MAKPRPRTIDQYWHKSGLCGVISRATLRTLQFVFAVTVAVLYGVDLAHSTKSNNRAHSEWIYAEFVAALSAMTCIVHCFITVTQVGWSAWDGVLFVLWLAQVGVFGTIYTSHVNTKYENATLSIPRMRAAVWIDLVNMVLWFATMVLGIAWCIRTRKVRRGTDQFGVATEGLIWPNGAKGINDEERGHWSGEEKYVKEFINKTDDGKFLQKQGQEQEQEHTKSSPAPVDKKEKPRQGNEGQT
ncbi:hypothetical protein N7471_006992 [Penicillium samsonianum]|uniref:uncharacterized protein n=1 Tax=Penicillium samsonianum TaxID=1882272 RepID=UPI0025499A36|nr:uncharacterized protein N7471_006992 [Penicillium samsonianum]KAJ6131777.1 hypothetical protein N7471_006992 [Penicillium samsonianum]